MRANALDVRDLVVSHPRMTLPAIDRVSAHVAPGRTLAVVGPSGAGKSTLLRAICGLLPISSGDVIIGGRSVVREAPQQRRAAMVFAHDALVRTMTIRQNLRMVARAVLHAARIEEVAAALDIGRHLDSYPTSLSTGERQRASIARALLSDPDVLLLDEPLAPLDPDLRIRVRDEIVHVRERFAGPIIFVTHDHADAMAVADDLLVLIDGRMHDGGDPQRVYDRPKTVGVARLFGSRPMNLIPGRAFGWNDGIAGFRPERARLALDGGVFRGAVERVERTGADLYVHLTTEYGRVAVRIATAQTLPAGEYFIDVAANDLCRFDASDE
ncbi:MAG TPA: ABC transporter ATP-binding protein [Candidatus Aquilonibacter sp.]|nr:ABC transporter ATP-binding protein [Candidatus Aquilonibacter sp.]